MLKKLGLPIVLGMAMLAPSALAADRDDRGSTRVEHRTVRRNYEVRHKPRVRVYFGVGPTYGYYPYYRSYYTPYYNRWGPYYNRGFYDRWGYWHPYYY
jgi:hypothetical protein